MDVQATVVLKGGTLTSSFDANAGEESTVACDTEISAARVEGVGTLLSPEGAELALRRIGMLIRFRESLTGAAGQAQVRHIDDRTASLGVRGRASMSSPVP